MAPNAKDSQKGFTKLSRMEALWESHIRVNIREAKEILVSAYGDPVQRKWTSALIGESGVGKSWMISQVAEELGIGFLKLVGSGLAAEDVRGFPALVRQLPENCTSTDLTEVMRSYYSSEPTYRFQLLESLLKAFTPGTKAILLLEEFAQAVKEVQDVFFQVIYDRRMDDRVLSDDVMVVTAMNPTFMTEYMLNKISHAAEDRLELYVLDPSAGEWLRWAKQAGIDGRVIDFIQQHPQVYDRVKGRRLHHLSDKISAHKDFSVTVPGSNESELVIPNIVRAKIYATVDVESADQFVKYLKEIFDLSGVQILLGDKATIKKLKSAMNSGSKVVFLYRIQQEMVTAIEHSEDHLEPLLKGKKDGWNLVARNLLDYLKLLLKNDMEALVSMLKSVTMLANTPFEEELNLLLAQKEYEDIYMEVTKCIRMQHSTVRIDEKEKTADVL